MNFNFSTDSLPPTTYDGLQLTSNRRLPPSEEKRALELLRRQMSGRSTSSAKALTPLSTGLVGLQAQVQTLVTAHPNPAPASNSKKVCPRCKGAKFLRRDLAPNHPDFGRAVRCPACSRPWQTYRDLVESIWPVPPKTLNLGYMGLDELPGQPQTTLLADLLEDVVTEWPAGVLICIDGAYGTAKSHALAIIYRKAWENKIGAAYLESAQKLEQIFTSFDKKERQTNVQLNAAIVRGDVVAGEELVHEERKIELSRNQLISQLIGVPWLLVDEAHRYSRKGGNGWVERHFAQLIDARLTRGKSTVLVGNGMGDGRIIGRPGPNSLHPSILDRARSQDCRWLDLSDLPSGRARYARNAGDWGKNWQLRNGS